MQETAAEEVADFCCSAVCTLAFAAGAVGFRCAEEKTVRNSYERVMKEASSSVTREKQIANYRKQSH